MCGLPGRNEGKFDRDMYQDIHALVKEYKINVLVTLNTMEELYHRRSDHLFDTIKTFADDSEEELISLHFPIRDFGVPTSMMEMDRFLHSIILVIRKIAENQHGNCNLVIHCNGGIGRTGIISACLLLKLQWMMDNHLHPESPQLQSQQPQSLLSSQHKSSKAKFVPIQNIIDTLRVSRKPQMLRNPMQKFYCYCYQDLFAPWYK
ncbi:hypothetical protein RFI_19198 [Reticulomyxa filosa]|uniref:Tyrosine specific protein phosphatases domain-containing protein n=1 Tax=Reticulomyxa filosa TaxID=46433 RepID=X6MX87_RETFI|nr:hypothetical protein RFI_19198 [Reticulomyxa filosa]|eukprot:ETO18092.1 hypothetical protein RFI_19198 [Reticulomyxa filosa]